MRARQPNFLWIGVGPLGSVENQDLERGMSENRPVRGAGPQEGSTPFKRPATKNRAILAISFRAAAEFVREFVETPLWWSHQGGRFACSRTKFARATPET